MSKTENLNDLKKLLKTMDFIEPETKGKWVEKSKSLNGKQLEIVCKKFKDAKNKIDGVYVRVALDHDGDKGKLIERVITAINKDK